MSAWTVSKNHANLLTQAYSMYVESVGDPDAFATNLLRENYKSVNYRYESKRRAPKVIYEPFTTGETHVDFRLLTLAQLHCYSYQTCEHPGWPMSRSYHQMKELEACILNSYGENKPAEDAWTSQPWGV